MTLDEYLQQQGYVYRPENRVETDGGMSGNFGGYGKYRTVGGGEVPEEQVFDEIERSETAKYYEDPSRFTKTRDTKFGQGLNTFNEGNEDQKRIVDQINSGQLYISPRLIAGKVRGEPEGGGEGYREETVYDLRDSRTGQTIQQVTPVDEAKGIFSIFADDKNSSGFFNNYVSTDPSGFVNPIVSEQQSQYQSRPNSSANFYRNALLSTIQMGAMFMSGGASLGIGEAILGAGATGAATLGGAVVGAGMNALTSAATGNDITAGGVLTGAAIGGIGANSMDIAANIVGGGDVIAGIETLSNIASEMGVKVADVGKIVSGAVATGIVAGANGNDVAEAITKNLVSSGLGAYAGGLVDSIDPGKMDTAVKVATNVAKVGATAAMNGTDITTALQNSLPSILTSSLTAGSNASTNATDTKVAEDTTLDDSGVKTASTIEVGDTSEFDPGTKITLADGSIGVVSGNGTIVPEGTVPDTTTVGFKEPTGSVSISGVIMENKDSPSGFSDDQGNPINQDGTPYLDPNEIDVAPTGGNNTTPLPTDYVPNPEDVKNTVKNADGSTSYVMRDGTVITDGQVQESGGVTTNTQGPSTSVGTDTEVPGPGGLSSVTGPGPDTNISGPGGLSSVTGPSPSTSGPLSVLDAGELTVTGKQEPAFDPWDNPEEDVTEETKTDPTKTTTVKVPTPSPTTSTTLPKVTLPSVTTSTAAPATTKTPFQPAADATGGIPNLTPGLTKAMNDYQLTGLNAIDTTPEMAGGGSTSAIDDLNAGKDYNPMAASALSYLKPGLTRANLQYALTGMPAPKMHKADGGEIMQEDLSMPEGHHPEFFSEGGLHNRYVRGDGDGTSDDVPAMLANGEWVIPADVVSALGNGSNDAGAKVLDEFMKVIREHKRSADAKHLPPDSKGALGYLAEAHSKVRA